MAGVDVIKTDKLGRLSLSIEGCKKRDQIVFSICKKKNIPIECSMGGGFCEDIDLIDLSLVLWRGKWIITTFISITVLIGFSYLFFTKDEIEAFLF